MPRAVMSISLDTKTAEAVEQAAEREGAKISRWAERAFKDYLEREEGGRSEGTSEN